MAREGVPLIGARVAGEAGAGRGEAMDRGYDR
jgi:hypothetical protein